MSKEKAPAFQVFPADYLSDINTMLMTMEEEGCYWRLMLVCWREGSLPTDSSALQGICKGVKVTSRVLSCFTVSGDTLLHPRLEKERQRQADWREKCAKGGRKGSHKPKHPKDKTTEKGSSTTEPRVVQVNGNSSSSSSFASVTQNTSPLIPQGGNGRRAPRSAVKSHRAPDQFTVSAEMREWARTNAPSVDVDRETEKFKNYEFKNAHSDWPATWRNWLLTAAERAGGVAGTPKQSSFKTEADRVDDGYAAVRARMEARKNG